MASPFIACILDMQKYLSQKVGVCDVKLFTHLPAERTSVTEWEKRHLCILPDDLKSFYLTSDGVQFSWSSKCGEVKTPVGRIALNPLNNLNPIKGNYDPSGEKISFFDLETSDSEDDGKEEETCPPYIGCSGCRAFELEASEHYSFVCIVYRNCRPGVPASNPEVWLLDRSFRWHFLVSSFTQYYRLMLVHLGLPHWQHLFCGTGIPPQCQQWYNLYAPLRLEMDIFTVPLATSTDNDVDKSPLDITRVFKSRGGEKKKANSGQGTPTGKGKRTGAGTVSTANKSAVGSGSGAGASFGHKASVTPQKR